MKTLKFVILSAILMVCGANAFAGNHDELVYNNQEVNGLMVSQTVYKNIENVLTNYMQYSYKYDNQNRMTESQSQKWNNGEWVNDMCIRYAYEGKQVTTTYYKWNKNKKQFVLVPSMTVTMDSANM